MLSQAGKPDLPYMTMPHEGNGCDQREWVLAALDEHERRLTRYAIGIAGNEEAAGDADPALGLNSKI